MRVFLDANVLFTAAHNPSGLWRLLFELHRHGVIALVTSHHAVVEARTNLALKAPTHLVDFEALRGQLELVDAAINGPPLPPLPEDDRLILAAAVAGRTSHLLTGDRKHFGRYFNQPDKTSGVCIQTPRQFFAERFAGP